MTEEILLSNDERSELVQLLCKLPLINIYPYVLRRDLLVGLPLSITANIEFNNILLGDLNSVVIMVTTYAGYLLEDGRYSLLIVMKNAVNMAVGTALARDLNDLANRVRGRLGLPLEIPPSMPLPPPPDYLMQKLYDIILYETVFEDELRKTCEAFAIYIRRKQCKEANTRLAAACTPLRDFATILENTDDLKVKRHRGWLLSALRTFECQVMAVEKSIALFCEKHGTVLPPEQPLEKREEIRKQVKNLKVQHKQVVQKAKELNEELRKP